jgi:hypothetical protein
MSEAEFVRKVQGARGDCKGRMRLDCVVYWSEGSSDDWTMEMVSSGLCS